MAADFFNGLIRVNNSFQKNPIMYLPEYSDARPPFTVTTSGQSKYVNVYKIIYNYTPLVNKFNTDSILWIKLEGAFRGSWQSIISNSDGNYHRVYTFGNGKYIEAMANSSNDVRLRFYNANNQLLGDWVSDIKNSKIPDVALCILADDTYYYAQILMYIKFSDYEKDFSIGGCLTNSSYNYNQTFFNDAVIDTSDPYGTIPDAVATGGYGSYDYGDGDDIPAPSKPTISASDSGFVTLFNPDITQLQDLADYMWGGLFDIGPWKKLMADPMDCIISLNIVPVMPTVSGTRELKVGNIGTGKQFSVISEQFKEIQCGSITLNGKTASNLDYSPYVQASIFLPFIGERPLDADDIMDSTITLSYIIDLFSGACTANIVCSKSITKSRNAAYNKSRLLYSFNGNCSCNIPYTSANYNNMLQSLVTAIGVGATAIATKGASLAGAAGIAQAGALVQSVTNEKPVINKAGNMGGTSGFMGQRTPYLIIKWPNQCRPKDVNAEIGQPSYLRGQLKYYHGFTRVHETFLEGLPCTEQERTEIDTLLKAGIILP